MKFAIVRLLFALATILLITGCGATRENEPSSFFTGGLLGRKPAKTAGTVAAPIPVQTPIASAKKRLEETKPATLPKIKPAKIKAVKLKPAKKPVDLPLGLRVGAVSNEIWVASVVPGSAADKAGIKEGDRIDSFDGQTLAGEGLRIVGAINAARGSGSSNITWTSPYKRESKVASVTWGPQSESQEFPDSR